MNENLNRKGRKQIGSQRFNMVMTDEDMEYLLQLKKELGCKSIAHTVRVVLSVTRAFGELAKQNPEYVKAKAERDKRRSAR